MSSTTSIDRSTCGSSIAGEISDILVKGALSKKHSGDDQPGDSLLKFSQSVPEHQPFEFHTTGERVGNEIEVRLSLSFEIDVRLSLSLSPHSLTHPHPSCISFPF